MPNEAEPSAGIEYTPEFKRNLRQLAKRYRGIKADLQPLLDELERQQTPGHHVPGVRYEVYKARVLNSDSGKGKSGGYRVIYQRTIDKSIVLVTIYSKTEQEDVSPHAIRQILLNYEGQMQEIDDASGEEPATTHE
jgi:mRNA-degrading endonuclease RelE of RelBE toxin-antitoxin system